MYADLKTIINKLKSEGEEINDPWDVVAIFEQRVAAFAGSKYAVTVDNCTNALFLCLKYLNATGNIKIPSKTYVSVPQTIIHAGCHPTFEDIVWSGVYPLSPYPIVDGATRFQKDMYVQDTYHCLSFHLKKILSIGKGGMILTNDKKAVSWFKKARYEGRDITLFYDDDPIDMLGWNMYMPPEQAGYGLELLRNIKDNNQDCGGSWRYRDVSQLEIFKDK